MIRIATIITAVLLAAVNTTLVKAERVNVTLNSGRVFTAYVDHRTDEDRLWLRFGTRSTRLLRPVSWDHIQSARYQGRDLSVAQLQSEAAELAAAGEAHETADRNGPSNVETDGRLAETHAERARKALAPVHRVRSVSFDAALANFDADVASDGLLVSVIALDDNGRPVAAQGTLEVTIVAPKRVAFNDVPTAGGKHLVRLGRWTQPVVTATRPAAPLRLAFQAAHPEHDTSWAPHAIVHVKLVIPGQGVFQDSLDGVRIRQFAPTRDLLERQTGRRFLAIER